MLLTGVTTVQRAVSAKNTLPILQGILIKAEEQSVNFAATDLEIGIRCKLPAQVIEEGTVVLPAKLFSEIVRKLPDTTITLEVIDDSVNIHYYESDISIKGYDPEEFPLLPDIFEPESFELPTSLFKTMVRQTVFACAADENRPVFTGVFLQIEGQTIRMISTDTHRLAYRVEEFPNTQGLKFSGIIPSKTMSEIYRLLRDEDELLTIRYNNSQVAFQFGSVYLLSRLIEGQFPNYKQVIPQSCETKVYINVRELLDAVERASLLSRDTSGVNVVRFNIGTIDGTPTLKIAQASEIGKICEQIEIELEGKEVGISFNAKFLLDALKVIDSEKILFELSGSYSPGVMRPQTDQNYLYLVLPLRT